MPRARPTPSWMQMSSGKVVALNSCWRNDPKWENMQAPSKLVLLHGIASKSKKILHNTTFYYIFKIQMCSKFITAIFTNNRQKSKVAAENLQGYAYVQPIANKCGSPQGRLQRYAFFTLMTMTSQCRACLRVYKNANHVYIHCIVINRNPKVQNSAFESLVGFNWRVSPA